MHSFACTGLQNHCDYLSTDDTEDTVLLSRSANQTLNAKLSTNILTLNTQTYAECARATLVLACRTLNTKL